MAIQCCLLKSWIFLLILRMSQSTVYVMDRNPFSAVINSFDDAVSLFGPELFRVEGFLVQAVPLNACTPIKTRPVIYNPLAYVPHLDSDRPVSGTRFIVLIAHGDCDSDLKVWHAQKANYSVAIVFNDVDNEIIPMTGHLYSKQIQIPSVFVDKSSGEELSTYLWSQHEHKYVISVVSFYSLPLKYVLLALLVLVGTSLLVLVGCFAAHLCNIWRRAHRGRLSRRHLRRLVIKRFVKGEDPYETCPICLEDFKDREKLRLLPCCHAFHSECIDPWLLNNRRRCPVCNQVVQLPGVQDSATDVRQTAESADTVPPTMVRNTMGRLSRMFVLARHGRQRSPRSNASTSSLIGTPDDETAPLLQHSTRVLSGSLDYTVHRPDFPTASTTTVTVAVDDVPICASHYTEDNNNDDDDTPLLATTNQPAMDPPPSNNTIVAPSISDGVDDGNKSPSAEPQASSPDNHLVQKDAHADDQLLSDVK